MTTAPALPAPGKAKAALREKILSVALSSAEFAATLEDAARDTDARLDDSTNEATVAGLFERVLYAELRDVGIQFHPTKEAGIDTRRHVGRGRADARLGAVMIEYKRPSRLRTAKDVRTASAQLEEYLASVTAQESISALGFLTDGRRYLEIRVDPEGTSRRDPLGC